ncbi:hypothetical protein NHF46_11720 [Arthrobacter alpinus]|nr:hypothetical protein [Arthrobacter alpinus]
MNTTGTTPTPARPSGSGLRGSGATTLAPEVASGLPPRTRIHHLWVEETPEGDRLVYCYIRDTVRLCIGIAAQLVFLAGIFATAAMAASGIIPLWLCVTSTLLNCVASVWASIWYPETGPGGNYPVDSEGRLLPKINNPASKD